MKDSAETTGHGLEFLEQLEMAGNVTLNEYQKKAGLASRVQMVQSAINSLTAFMEDYQIDQHTAAQFRAITEPTLNRLLAKHTPDTSDFSPESPKSFTETIEEMKRI